MTLFWLPQNNFRVVQRRPISVEGAAKWVYFCDCCSARIEFVEKQQDNVGTIFDEGISELHL